MFELEIVPIPAFETNYIWLGVNAAKKIAFVVDPGEAEPVLTYLKTHALQLKTILLTHKHGDHVGGVAALKAAYPGVSIYGHPTEGIASVTHPVEDQQQINFADFAVEFQVLYIPGHTLGHVAYYAAPLLFCGDTLFGGGCGRCFEGTPVEMFNSLKRLAALPNETKVYCAHEYTLANLKFARQVEPLNQKIAERIWHTQALRAQGLPSVPSTLLLEKQTNPFLRCDQPEIMEQVSQYVHQTLQQPLEVFTELRFWKDAWVG